MKVANTVKPKMTVQKTNALIANQGYTYNESGLTYNEIGVQYGGIYNYDIVPIIATATNTQPKINSITDMPNTLPVRVLKKGMSMGLLLDLTYPTTEVIFL